MLRRSRAIEIVPSGKPLRCGATTRPYPEHRSASVWVSVPGRIESFVAPRPSPTSSGTGLIDTTTPAAEGGNMTYLFKNDQEETSNLYTTEEVRVSVAP
jgi:hypothetical protein